MTLITGWPFPSSYFTGNDKVFGNYGFIYSDFISTVSYDVHSLHNVRLNGLFWEPSVLAVFTIFALFINTVYWDKYSWYRIVLYALTIVGTQSTAGFILFYVWIVFHIGERIKSNKKFLFIGPMVALVVLGIILWNPVTKILSDLIPTVFGKLVEKGDNSFVSRLFSFTGYLNVWKSSPKSIIFGRGGYTANINFYSEWFKSGTSTIGYMIASYGIVGFIWTFSTLSGLGLSEKISLTGSATIFVSFLLVSSVQCQSSILALFTIYMAPIVSIELPAKLKKINESNYGDILDKPLTTLNVIQSRSENGVISQNVIGSFLLKGVAIILSFVTVPTYLAYFSNDDGIYGIWLTIASLLSVITIFDMGLGNGLKNKLVDCFKKNDESRAKSYVSTIYLLTFIIGIAIFTLLVLILFILPDKFIVSLFFKDGSSTISVLKLKIAISIVLLGIGIEFSLKNITYILQAHQKNAISGIFMLITNASILIFAFSTKYAIADQNKILAMSIVYSLMLNLPYLIGSIYLFTTKYHNLSPSLRCIDMKNSKDAIILSTKFFFTQFGTFFMWALNEILISSLFGRTSVTEYTEFYKLFSLIITIFGTIIQQPFWVAISTYATSNSYKDIRSLYKKLAYISLLFIFINVILTFSLPLVFNIWLDKNAPDVLPVHQIVFCVYSFVFLIGGIFVVMCNGLSLFKGQLFSAILCVCTKVPLLILFSSLNLFPIISSTWLVVIAFNVLLELPILIICPFEIRKELKRMEACHEN